MERGRLRELRHDFRHYYHVGYDEVDVEEAVDLALTLPPGSLYVARTRPELSWSEARETAADIRDDMAALAYALRGAADPPKVVRPRDVVELRRAAERSREARRRIEETAWEEA